jgi:hypothetical protein
MPFAEKFSTGRQNKNWIEREEYVRGKQVRFFPAIE